MLSVLITGANGQLGQCLQEVSKEADKLEFIFCEKDELDITNSNCVAHIFKKHTPNIVINTAAFTNVDKAEEEKEKAYSINVKGVQNLIAACETTHTKLLQISTDYVFDGTTKEIYRPNQEVSPINYYGKTKAEAEQLIRSSSINHCIIRTSWLYSEFGHNFVKTISNLAAKKSELNVVNDQVGRPTYAIDLARAILAVVMDFPATNKVYHFANMGQCSWYELAKNSVSLRGLDCKVKPVGTNEYPSIAKRPAQTILDTTEIETDFNITIRHWQEALMACLKNIK